MFVSGLTAIAGPLQWLAAICGWVGIVYVMFGGVRTAGVRERVPVPRSRVPVVATSPGSACP